MKRSRVFLLVVGLAICGLVWVAVRAAKAKKSGLATLAALNSAQTQLTDRLHRLESENRVAEVMVEVPAEPIAAITPTAEPPAQAATPKLSYAEWRKQPAVQALHFAMIRGDLPLSYGPFFQTQNLSPAQSDKLRDLLVDDIATRQDIGAIGNERNLSSSEVQQLRQQQATKLREAEIELLGADGYAKLKEYERALPIRKFVANVAGGAAIAGVPLSREQGEQLTSILAQAEPQYIAGGPTDFGKIDWTLVEPQARAILSDRQFKILRAPPGGKTESRESRQLSNAIHRAINATRSAEIKAAP